MKGFRRAQLRGSEELFRPTDDTEPRQEVMAVAVPAEVEDGSGGPRPPASDRYD